MEVNAAFFLCVVLSCAVAAVILIVIRIMYSRTCLYCRKYSRIRRVCTLHEEIPVQWDKSCVWWESKGGLFGSNS